MPDRGEHGRILTDGIGPDGTGHTCAIPRSDGIDAARCVIMAAGTAPSDQLVRECLGAVSGRRPLVVAADGGFVIARRAGIRPDALIGDGDSLARLERLSAYPVQQQVSPSSSSTGTAGTARQTSPQAMERIVLSPQKDDIDLVCAARWAWLRGAREFTILGALGGRPDMSLAAIQLAARISQAGGMAVLRSDDWSLTALTDGTLRLGRVDGRTCADIRPVSPISVLALSDTCTGVTLDGLLYTLDDATMTNTSARWISNEPVHDADPHISVEEGTLAVTWPSGLRLAAWQSRRAEHPAASIGKVDTTVSANLTGMNLGGI